MNKSLNLIQNNFKELPNNIEAEQSVIGSIGEIIDVKRGFARNYLILNKKALYASKENIKEVEKIKVELNKKDQEKKKNAKQTFEALKNKIYEVKKLTTENKKKEGGGVS